MLADINAGLLYLLAITSMGVYGIILAGWASNSKYAFLGAMRSAAQMVAYEIAMGFALVGVLMAAGSLNLGEIVEAQAGRRLLSWYWLAAVPAVRRLLHLGRRRDQPRAVRRGGRRVGDRRRLPCRVLGHRVRAVLPGRVREHDPDRRRWPSIMFLGGWLSPFEGYPVVGDIALLAAPGLHWLRSRSSFFLFCFLWFRATFPRYRYDQIMRLGWKVFIPVTLVWIVVDGVLDGCDVGPWAAVRQP